MQSSPKHLDHELVNMGPWGLASENGDQEPSSVTFERSEAIQLFERFERRFLSVACVLARLDERREFRECLPPAGFVVDDRHAGR